MTAKKTYLAKISQRARLHEQRAKTLESEATHLRLSLDAALDKIRSLELTVAELKANAIYREELVAELRAKLKDVDQYLGDTDLTTPQEERELRGAA